MTSARIGSLFSGYGGLEMGVQAVLGGETVWHSEIDPGACKVLAHRYPHMPNLGDITTVDWSQVEPVDILAGGFPCQDVSAAGKRAGIRPDTRSGLWSQFAYAIGQLRPGLVVIENVRGLLSADAHHPAHSDLEPCPWCVGDGERRSLRALGAVLGELADLGYDASWQGLRAADVGAPHGRFRVFVIAWDASGSARRGPQFSDPRARLVGAAESGEPAGTSAVNPNGMARAQKLAQHWRPEPVGESRAVTRAVGPDRAPLTADAEGDGWHEGWPESARLIGGLDAAECSGEATPDPAELRRRATGWDDGVRAEGLVARYGSWGEYEPAIRRWERCLGRSAPPPSELSAKGLPRLSPTFVEWMQGLPAGWVTNVPGLSRNEQLKALGNGVVPQQAAYALQLLLPDMED